MFGSEDICVSDFIFIELFKKVRQILFFSIARVVVHFQIGPGVYLKEDTFLLFVTFFYAMLKDGINAQYIGFKKRKNIKKEGFVFFWYRLLVNCLNHSSGCKCNFIKKDYPFA